MILPATQLKAPCAENCVQDCYFLDGEKAMETALLNQRVLSGSHDTRTQICYYDGDPLEDAPLNLIHVPSSNFADFFTSNFLPLPAQIFCRSNMDSQACAAVEETFAIMIREIVSSRESSIQKWDGYPHHLDSYFLDPRMAYQTALQQNRVFLQHLTKTGLQVCYYDGPIIENAPANLINVPAEQLLDYLSNCRTRLPARIVYPAHIPLTVVQEGEQAFEELLQQAKTNRTQASREFATHIKNCAPVFQSDKPLRIFFLTDHRTQVLQYVVKNLAKSFRDLGHETFISMEHNDMEELDSAWHLKELIDFQPQITVNINHRNNHYLHPDIFNVIWYQDPMPEIRKGKSLEWRNRDLILSISPELDSYLRQCGAPRVERQFSCIDHTVFSRISGVTRQNNAVFIGSSYSKNVYQGPNADKIVNRLKDAFHNGELIDKQLCYDIAQHYHVKVEKVWPYTANYVIRDTVVQWLCENPHVPVEVYGRYWESDPIVAPHFKGELDHGLDVAMMYNQSKYAISALTLAVNSQRLAELSGCGCIPVVYDTREAADQPHWDNECLFFKTRDELYACLTQTPSGNPHAIAEAYRYDTLAKRLLQEITSKLGQG